jgi:hypothetical protein
MLLRQQTLICCQEQLGINLTKISFITPFPKMKSYFPKMKSYFFLPTACYFFDHVTSFKTSYYVNDKPVIEWRTQLY